MLVKRDNKRNKKSQTRAASSMIIFSLPNKDRSAESIQQYCTVCKKKIRYLLMAQLFGSSGQGERDSNGCKGEGKKTNSNAYISECSFFFVFQLCSNVLWIIRKLKKIKCRCGVRPLKWLKEGRSVSNMTQKNTFQVSSKYKRLIKFRFYVVSSVHNYHHVPYM